MVTNTCDQQDGERVNDISSVTVLMLQMCDSWYLNKSSGTGNKIENYLRHKEIFNIINM